VVWLSDSLKPHRICNIEGGKFTVNGRFSAGSGNFSLHYRIQNDSGAYPASYPMGTRGCVPGVKRPGREAYYSSSSNAEVKECVELYLHSPNKPSWRGAQLKTKHRDNFTFTFMMNLYGFEVTNFAPLFGCRN
jgi:hypothetical protein